MKFGPLEIKDRAGRKIVLRNAEIEDAEDLLRYLKITAGETPYLIREPDEITLTVEQEQDFIQGNIDSNRELLLVATIEDKCIGTCSIRSVGNSRRYAHRCDVGIALYRDYWGAGVGRIMLDTILDIAKRHGYEQAELEVSANNENAIALYEKLGFIKHGRFPDNMKYKDGTYVDAYWMQKKL